MRPKDLRRARVVIGTAVSLLFCVVYLDPGSALSGVLSDYLIPTQLGPALIKTLHAGGVWIASAAAVLLATLVAGRVYCSTACPLGALQDLFIWLRRRLNRRVRFAFEPPPRAIHLGILALTAASVAVGILLPLSLLEPFSLFGRILTALGRPLVLGVHNLAAAGLSTLDVYWLFPAKLYAPDFWVVGGAAILLGSIGALSFFKGRLFCNMLCPVGALLSVVSRFSILRIAIDKENCAGCGVCEKVCKAACVDSKNLRIDMSACVGCFDCVAACPTVGISYAPRDRQLPVDEGRRAAVAAVLVPVAGYVAHPLTGESTRPVTPPGSGSEKHFTETCTACHLCVSVCPARVLAPSILAYGVAGMFQPRMDFHASYCTYDCALCTTVCPTGAILPLGLEEKKSIQIGRSVFVKDDCIVITKKTDCGACSEHCPTKAVTMVRYEGRFLPHLDNDLCVGCGACEFACPTKPGKAIYVEASSVHGRARKPAPGQAAPKVDVPAEFPF